MSDTLPALCLAVLRRGGNAYTAVCTQSDCTFSVFLKILGVFVLNDLATFISKKIFINGKP
jgi:hypothetical protein